MSTIELTESALGGTHEVRLGDELSIRLNENATTGYRWHVTASGDGALQQLDDSFQPGGTSLPPGSAGVRVLRFAATRPGTVHVSLANRRAWEQDPAQQRHLTVVIRAAIG
jgi:predicted secreted protein